MNSLFLTTLLSQLRQIANYPNVLNIPFNANRASKIREDILSVAKDVEKREPIVASQLIRAKDLLFYTNQIGQPLLNPYALGEIIFGLNYLEGKQQVQRSHPDPENAQWAYIHPLIQKASKKLYVDGSYANAATDAFIEINDRAKKLFRKIKPNDEKVPDGSDAMKTVFQQKTLWSSYVINSLNQVIIPNLVLWKCLREPCLRCATRRLIPMMLLSPRKRPCAG